MARRFHFAYVDPGTVFNPAVHNREDEKIVSFAVEQLETEFANLSIDIRNPRIGILNIGRQIWAWLSYDNGSEIVPLFFGRVVGIPTNINRELVTLQLIARPSNFAAQKIALAATMRDLPYYDPVFISEDKAADPDVVLEARTEVWHIDRVSHVLTASDLLVGDSTLEFLENEVPYASVEISLDQPPVRIVHVEASVPWTQHAASEVGQGIPLITNMRIETIAGEGLRGGWPKPQDDLGGGWFAVNSIAKSPYEDLTDDDFGAWASRIAHNVSSTPELPFSLQVQSGYSASSSSGGDVSISTTTFAIIEDIVFCTLSLGYKAERQRKDTVIFDLVADTQAIVTEPEDTEFIKLILNGNDVGLPTGLLGEVPISNDLYRDYFCSTRGKQSIQYLIQLARANIIVRSRAVKITFDCPFNRATELSLRKNARIFDRRLPGGEAVGKIVGYTFGSSGGKIVCRVTMACAIGYGGAISAEPGDATYVEDDYVEEDYYYRDDQVIVLGASDVGFTPLLADPNDDGLSFPLNHVPLDVAPHVVGIETKSLLPVAPISIPNMSSDDCGNTTSTSVNQTLDTGPYTEWLGGVQTTVNFSMQAVEGGPFETTYMLNVTLLKLPQQIDLEAPSV